MNYDALNKMFDEEVTFYVDKLNTNDVYVEYPQRNGALCFEPIKSKQFEAFITMRYCQLVEAWEKPEYKAALFLKECEAIYTGENVVPIHRRVAGSISEGEITYFLADNKWRYVTVTPEGCEISTSSKLKFLKSAMDVAQVLPKGGGDYLALMLPKINMERDDALLYAVYIL